MKNNDYQKSLKMLNDAVKYFKLLSYLPRVTTSDLEKVSEVCSVLPVFRNNIDLSVKTEDEVVMRNFDKVISRIKKITNVYKHLVVLN